jgi:alpha-D-xyloside xylohydrolase
MFRVHGTGEGKELWAFAPEVQKILLSFDQLRYRLLPYIYSASWDVTRHRGTMMRALAMDFREDEKALNIPDQFMFGRALLVSPIVQQGARIRSLYLPGGTDWYDFWTGARMVGGQVIAGQADLSRIPLHVRAGTILPLGPIKPYADAPSDDPLELRVYPGHDGSFELYDDEGDGFGYEQGRFATVSFRWNDATHRLDIGQRQGSFPGMKPSQQLSIRCGSHNAGQAVSVTYNGKAISVDLSECRAPAQG